MSHSHRKSVLVVFGTRPEAIKLAPVILALKNDPRFNVFTCSSGQHKDMVAPVCGLFGIDIDFDLGIMVPGQSLDHITTAILQGLPSVFNQTNPDAVMVQGDTTTAFASALSAFHHKISIAHVEAGLRTQDLTSPWPEEGNRALIGRLATYHFPPTEAACSNLIAEKAHGQIVTTGNTVVDAALVASDMITGVKEAEIALRLGVSNGKRPKILFTMHRRESHGEPVRKMFSALREIAEEHDVDILFPVHPNPNIHGPAHELLGAVPNIHLLNPMDYDEIIFSLKNARILITDSGGLAEEAPTFKTPALILRESTERPESIDAGGAVLIGYDTDRLKTFVRELLTDSETYRTMAAAPNPFGDGQASQRICDLLAADVAELAQAA